MIIELENKVDRIKQIRHDILDFIDKDFFVEYGFLADFENGELLDFIIGENGEVNFWGHETLQKFSNIKHNLVNIHTHSYYFENGNVLSSEIYPSLEDFSLFIASRPIFKYHMIIATNETLFLEFHFDFISVICIDHNSDYTLATIIKIDYPYFFKLPYITSYHLIVFYNIINAIDEFYQKLGFSIKDNGIILK